MRSYNSLIKIWVVFAVLAFPAFYFVYKFGNPELGCRDYKDYYALFKDLNIDGVEAPFNMRLISSFFVHLMYKMGLHYDTEIVSDALGLERSVFFCAVFFNYLCVVSTCVVLFQTIKTHLNNVYMALFAGVAYLLGFGTLFFVMMPITDAFSIFIFSIIFYQYLKKNYWALVFLVLIILQREYYFLALGLYALCDFWKTKDKYYLYMLLTCIACFGTYMVLRKTIFFTPKYDHQASAGFFVESVFSIKFPLVPYLKQLIMTMNIFILYTGVLIYKWFKKTEVDGFGFVKLLILFFQINVISFAAVFGNNTGRYFYMLIPMVIFYLVKEVNPLLHHER